MTHTTPSLFEANRSIIQEDIFNRDKGVELKTRFDELCSLHKTSTALSDALSRAIEMGEDRPPCIHNIFVHRDWLVRQARQGVTGPSALLAAAPQSNYVAIQAESDKDSAALAVIRSIESQGRLTGFLNDEGWVAFLEATSGLNGKDRFVVHGGEWHACQIHFASQLLGILIGQPFPSDVRTPQGLEHVLLSGCKGHSNEWGSLLVELGKSLDHGSDSAVWASSVEEAILDLGMKVYFEKISRDEADEKIRKLHASCIQIGWDYSRPNQLGHRMLGDETELFTRFSYD